MFQRYYIISIEGYYYGSMTAQTDTKSRKRMNKQINIQKGDRGNGGK